jgi:hypothetical protein
MSAPRRLRYCCGLAVVPAVAAAIWVTALTGQTVPAITDPLPDMPPMTTTAVPVPLQVLPAGLDQETSTIDEPPTNEPPTNEPPTDEPPTDEPPTDEPPTEEPPTDEPSTTEVPPTTNRPPITTTEPPVTTTTEPPVTTTTEPPVTTTTEPPVTTTTERPVVPASSESTGGWVLALLLVVVCVLLLSAGLLVRASRHRGVSWVKAHVTVAPRPGPGATFETRLGDELNRDHVLTVVPVEVRSSTILEENPL